jgi:predicted Holliday junction resolvase-like endonuclease
MGLPPIKLKEKNKYVITTITTAAVIIVGYLSYKLYKMVKQNQDIAAELKKATFNLRSAYVRFGKTFEQFVPFTKDFTQEEKNGFVFLGMPIDGIIFGEDSIKFVEIKTGEAQLSGKQKKIKKMIENGQVEFMEVRY